VRFKETAPVQHSNTNCKFDVSAYVISDRGKFDTAWEALAELTRVFRTGGVAAGTRPAGRWFPAVESGGVRDPRAGDFRSRETPTAAGRSWGRVGGRGLAGSTPRRCHLLKRHFWASPSPGSSISDRIRSGTYPATWEVGLMVGSPAGVLMAVSIGSR